MVSLKKLVGVARIVAWKQLLCVFTLDFFHLWFNVLRLMIVFLKFSVWDYATALNTNAKYQRLTKQLNPTTAKSDYV